MEGLVGNSCLGISPGRICLALQKKGLEYANAWQ